VDRLFLDANVLFSAAYRKDAGVARLWDLRGRALITSDYAVEEARRNLTEPHHRERLAALLDSIEVTSSSTLDPSLRGEVDLPEKDWPILSGALASGTTHLITGDFGHFGPFFGTRILGVLILAPSDYLRSAR